MMPPRWSMRTRIALFFLLLALTPLLLVGTAVVVALALPLPEAQRLHNLSVFTFTAAVLSALVVALVWQLFDRHVGLALQRLARDLQTHVHAARAKPLAANTLRYLGPVGPASQALLDTLRGLREERDQDRERAERSLRAEQQRLAILIRDLDVGVLVASVDHRIILYNQQALRALQVSEQLGLSRPVHDVIQPGPVQHAIDRLMRGAEGRRDPAAPIPLILCPVSSERLLRGSLSGLFALSGELTGYVLNFTDDTEILATALQRERLYAAALQGAASPVDALLDLSEQLEREPIKAGGGQAVARAMATHAADLKRHLQGVSEQLQRYPGAPWPMADFLSDDLFEGVRVRCHDDDPKLVPESSGQPVWLYGNTFMLEALLSAVVMRLGTRDPAAHAETPMTLRMASHQGTRSVCLRWQGPDLSDEWLATALATPLPGDPMHMSGQDVLDAHRTRFHRAAAAEAGCRHLILPLRISSVQGDERCASLPSRPEFYDFDLFSRATPLALADSALEHIDYVVFDTETTGLEPSNGDEILSIAAVRIVNGRVLTGETFDELIDPGRRIPPASIRFHGVTDEMVKGKPLIGEVLPRFARYVGDAVLVAHNAAFDMKFLSLKQASTGVGLDNPVLDTVLLSAWLHDHTGKHTLDDLADRFGVRIRGRHTALGDAKVTADVFQCLLPALKARGVNTLSEALAASDSMSRIKRAQKSY